LTGIELQPSTLAVIIDAHRGGGKSGRYELPSARLPGMPAFRSNHGMASAHNPVYSPVLSVSELTLLVKEVLECNFDAFWVRGEVSNLKRSRPGHVYFTLKDEDDGA
jgi:hypothetical protein